jgi:hypothetical protein
MVENLAYVPAIPKSLQDKRDSFWIESISACCFDGFVAGSVKIGLVAQLVRARA